MPKFSVDVPHTMGGAAAKAKLESFMSRIGEFYRDQIKDLEQRWEGDTMHFGFKTLGLRILGQMHVQEQQVRVHGDLPFAAMMFKGKIENDLRTQLEKLLR